VVGVVHDQVEQPACRAAVRHQRVGEDLEEEGHCGDGRVVDALVVPVAEFTLGVLTASTTGPDDQAPAPPNDTPTATPPAATGHQPAA
jgi:hypothetical protein